MTPREAAEATLAGARGQMPVDGVNLDFSDYGSVAHCAVFGAHSQMFGKSMAHRGAFYSTPGTSVDEVEKRIKLVVKREKRLVQSISEGKALR